MDNVNHPSHYAEHCSVECIDIIRLALGDDGFKAYCLGNAIKYLWRYKYKSGSEDLQKAGIRHIHCNSHINAIIVVLR